MNIYVGNISPRTTASQLRKAFEMYGKVNKVSLGSRPRDNEVHGFCFIEMPFENQASRVVKQLAGKMLGGNALTVRESGVSV